MNMSQQRSIGLETSFLLMGFSVSQQWTREDDEHIRVRQADFHTGFTGPVKMTGFKMVKNRKNGARFTSVVELNLEQPIFYHVPDVTHHGLVQAISTAGTRVPDNNIASTYTLYTNERI